MTLAKRLFSIAFSFALTALLFSGCGQQDQSPAPTPRMNARARSPKTNTNPNHISAPAPFHAPREFTPRPTLATTDPTSPDYIREWNWFTTVADYQRVGRTNPAWDADAIEAMERYCDARVINQGGAALDAVQKRGGEAAAKAIAAHCDDPLVEYIHLRFVLSRQSQANAPRLSEPYTACADSFEKTDYSPVRKMYASLRAADEMKQAIGFTTNTPPRLIALRRAAVQHLNEALHDTKMPPREAADITSQVWEVAQLSGHARYDVETLLIPTLQTLWTNHAFAYTLFGKYYLDKAWLIRGTGYANTVTEDRWKGFHDTLEQSYEAFQHAWVLDQKDVNVPIELITVCMGLSLPRQTMETWFDRAMAIAPNSYDAVRAKEYYLEPKWLGSEEEVLAFGRECVASKEWGGNVPLILKEIHHSLQKYHNVPVEKYFSSPEVWRDVSNSYERYFELNPKNVGWRHDYARDAFNAGQYKVFLEQVPKFTTGTNYEFFGGKQKFDAMVQTATEKTR